MFAYTQKDIILVPFPFTDLSSSKKRPVLIISNNQINGSGIIEDFIGVALTSTLRNTDYSVVLHTNDYEDGALPIISEVQCSKIASLSKDIVIKKLCSVKDEKFQAIREAILKAIGAVE